MGRIETRDKQFIIDGQPRLIIGGEIHYFRLKRSEWADRIAKLKAAGCNAVASYIPWLCHEPTEGEIDLTGRTRPELDLGAFIDLCRDNGLYFMARPGPFIMAEMKNEGLPYWVYTKHPEIVPVSWDGKLAPSRTVDYLAPGFLAETRHWYEAVMAVIQPRLHLNGGNIIAVQLDNEIGMLSWVTNAPDLTDQLLADFTGWLKNRYPVETLKTRYPFMLDNPIIRGEEIRSPKESFAAELMRDLGHYMRDRFARYIAALRGYAEEFGVKDVPFIVNVHGTDAGRGFSFPIGISQLYPAYTQSPGYLAGSDHYLGDLTISNFQDLYLINAFIDATNNPEQPLTSVEFEAGSGDYAGNYGGRYDPASVDFKTRMCVAQGNRFLNYYLFTGGINYMLDEPPHDGNDRISFTGERHGVAAPVNPEGELNYTYDRLSQTVHTLLAVEDKLAAMREERDPVLLGFIPDYYMTESKYPGSLHMREIVENLTAFRGPDAWEVAVKAMLLGGYRFGAVNVQDKPFDPQNCPVLVLPSAQYMDGGLQTRLVKYLNAGGQLLLYGQVPQFDMDGQPCTVLAGALGLTPTGTPQASTFYYLSLYSEGWFVPHTEQRTHVAQTFEPSRGEVLLRVVGTDEACGFDIAVGKGQAVVLSAAYTCDIDLFRKILEKLGAKAALRHDCPHNGIFMTASVSEEGERFLHLLNLDGFDKELRVTLGEKLLFEGKTLKLRAKTALLLPLEVDLGEVKIVYATAEIQERGEKSLEFRRSQPQDVIVLETDCEIEPGDDYEVKREGQRVVITSRKNALVDDRLTVKWR